MTEAAIIRLDLGCGTRKKEGFIGVDSRKYDGVDEVIDLRNQWPWADNSVDEVNASHVVEHFEPLERIHFANELHRVLKPGGKCTLSVPHWCSQRAYGDLDHKWPPVSEFWFYYLEKSWRAENAPHNDKYQCDFAATWGYAVRAEVAVRHVEAQHFMMNNYKEACMDMLATLIKK